MGIHVLGMTRQDVSTFMALLALITCVVALMVGLEMQRRGWGTRLLTKLQLVQVVVVVQTALTAVAPDVSSQTGVWSGSSSVRWP
jgi:uncharacterized membrane protein